MKLRFCSLVFLCACTVSPTPNKPAAPSSGTPAPKEEPKNDKDDEDEEEDEEKKDDFVVVETTPKAGAKSLKPFGKIEVRFSSPLDLSTINRTTVWLFSLGEAQRATYATVLTVSADGETLEIAFLQNAENSVTGLLLDGVKDTAGRALEPTSLSWINQHPYDDMFIGPMGFSYTIKRQVDEDGLLESWEMYDPSGDLNNRELYVRKDGLPMEATSYDKNNTIDGIKRFERFDDGQVSRLTVFNGAGADGKWRTSDDEVQYTVDFERDASGVVTGSTVVDGTDTSRHHFTYNATHDLLSDYNDGLPEANVYEVDQNGNRVFEGLAFEAGADGVFLTADDNMRDYEVRTFAGVLMQTEVDMQCGNDKLPRTADDYTESHQVRTWGATNTGFPFVAVRDVYAGWLDDNIVITDEYLVAYAETKLEGGVRVEKFCSYKGDDEVWRTADDGAESTQTWRPGF